MIQPSHAAWMADLLRAVQACGEEGASAVAYIQKYRTPIGFRRARPNVGAFWNPLGGILLNTHYYTHQTPFSDLRLLTLIIHETRHLQQGLVTALSVYGELDAWQLEFRVYQRLAGKLPHSVLAELLALPLYGDRTILRHARTLMQAYAGKGYRVDLLPLYPLPSELRFHLTGRAPENL